MSSKNNSPEVSSQSPTVEQQVDYFEKNLVDAESLSSQFKAYLINYLNYLLGNNANFNADDFKEYVKENNLKKIAKDFNQFANNNNRESLVLDWLQNSDFVNKKPEASAEFIAQIVRDEVQKVLTPFMIEIKDLLVEVTQETTKSQDAAKAVEERGQHLTKTIGSIEHSVDQMVTDVKNKIDRLLEGVNNKLGQVKNDAITALGDLEFAAKNMREEVLDEVKLGLTDIKNLHELALWGDRQNKGIVQSHKIALNQFNTLLTDLTRGVDVLNRFGSYFKEMNTTFKLLYESLRQTICNLSDAADAQKSQLKDQVAQIDEALAHFSENASTQAESVEQLLETISTNHKKQLKKDGKALAQMMAAADSLSSRSNSVSSNYEMIVHIFNTLIAELSGSIKDQNASNTINMQSIEATLKNIQESYDQILPEQITRLLTEFKAIDSEIKGLKQVVDGFEDNIRSLDLVTDQIKENQGADMNRLALSLTNNAYNIRGFLIQLKSVLDQIRGLIIIPNEKLEPLGSTLTEDNDEHHKAEELSQEDIVDENQSGGESEGGSEQQPINPQELLENEESNVKSNDSKNVNSLINDVNNNNTANDSTIKWVENNQKNELDK